MLLLTWCFNLAGMAFICFASARHRKPFAWGSLSSAFERCYRTSGFLLLAAALLVTCIHESIGNGIVLWVGQLTLMALLLTGLLSYQKWRQQRRPRAR